MTSTHVFWDDLDRKTGCSTAGAYYTYQQTFDIVRIIVQAITDKATFPQIQALHWAIEHPYVYIQEKSIELTTIAEPMQLFLMSHNLTIIGDVRSLDLKSLHSITFDTPHLENLRRNVLQEYDLILACYSLFYLLAWLNPKTGTCLYQHMPSTKAIPDAILYTDGKYFEHTGVIEMLRFLIEDEPIFEVDTLQSKPWYSHAKNIVMNNFADKVLLLLNLDLRSRLSEL